MSKEIEGIHMDHGEEDAYFEVFHALAPEDRHQLLGHPDPGQGEMTEQCERVYHGLYAGDESGWNDPRAPELRAGRADWRLLLQVASDDAPRMMWGDAGFLYYWIRDEDLGEQAFDQAWLILQCA